MPSEEANDDGEDANKTCNDDEDENEDEEEEGAEDDNLEGESDTETVETNATNDTTATSDTTKTVDSLYDDVRFAREEQEDKEKEKAEMSQANKVKKPPVDLRELVKQDLKKIVSSIDFFDEEKYEGGKKLTKKEPAISTSTITSETVTEDASTFKENDTPDKQESAEPNSSTAEKKTTGDSDENPNKKRVRTAAGTFN